MNRIAWLIHRLLKDELTPAESRELDDWLASDPSNKAFLERFEDPLINRNLASMSEIDWKQGYEKFVQRNPEYRRPEENTVKRSPAWFLRAAAAAILLLVLSALGWLILNRPSSRPVAVQGSQQQRYAQDVQPGGNRAVLTIGNEPPIILDTMQKTLQSGGSLLRNKNGLLEYQLSTSPDSLSINTITTPNGGTYRVILPDGTRVWLNAASFIRFPSAFKTRERLVTIEGEVYFEVARDPSRQFIVQSPHARMEVLGTHFNVSDYNNDLQTKATLLEGSLAVSGKTGRVLLKPGTQAAISRSGNMDVQAADIESAIAWKNGYFIFNGAPLQQILQQLERWYDVKVIRDTGFEGNFVAAIRRDEPLSKVLKLLELTGEVKFSIEGKTIRVFR